MHETSQPAASGGFLRRRPLRRMIKNWRERHQHPFNFWIHMIGIPLAVAGVILFFFVPWSWALMTFVLAYILQSIGHRAEGNALGACAAIKRLLPLSYAAIAP